ncbi:MAG: TetR family transcriptional regulator C-terminal domain-containing protein [Micromonosporaceae bacterium]|nr:TetR family transcriptional regulator C-terminal domain-containing protein [Micromonosporaceae bacterium]
MRGLTHRAVDRAAGVPEGSTSYYFRTRLALLVGVTERLLALDLADAAVALPVTALDLDTVADLATQIVAHWTGPGRDRMLARYEISLESVRHPELRARFLATGATLRTRIAETIAHLGAPDPHRAGRDFAAMLDGLIYDQLAGASGPRPAAELRATIRQMLAGLVGAPQR